MSLNVVRNCGGGGVRNGLLEKEASSSMLSSPLLTKMCTSRKDVPDSEEEVVVDTPNHLTWSTRFMDLLRLYRDESLLAAPLAVLLLEVEDDSQHHRIDGQNITKSRRHR